MKRAHLTERQLSAPFRRNAKRGLLQKREIQGLSADESLRELRPRHVVLDGCDVSDIIFEPTGLSPSWLPIPAQMAGIVTRLLGLGRLVYSWVGATRGRFGRRV